MYFLINAHLSALIFTPFLTGDPFLRFEIIVLRFGKFKLCINSLIINGYTHISDYYYLYFYAIRPRSFFGCWRSDGRKIEIYCPGKRWIESHSTVVLAEYTAPLHTQFLSLFFLFLLNYRSEEEEKIGTCADSEVGHSNTEESVLYFIRKKSNLFWTPSLILPYV